MLNITVNLSSEVSDILKYFGSIESVANKALKAISDGLIDLEGIPKYKFSTGRLKQFRITVDNPQYEEQYKMYGSHCNQISLARILNYIALDEVYEQLGWKQEVTKVETSADRIYRRIYTNLVDAMNRYLRVCETQGRTKKLNKIKNLIKELCDEEQ